MHAGSVIRVRCRDGCASCPVHVGCRRVGVKMGRGFARPAGKTLFNVIKPGSVNRKVLHNKVLHIFIPFALNIRYVGT